MLSLFSDKMQNQEDIWRQELKFRGYMTCPYKQCSLVYMTLKSMKNHTATCTGTVEDGDYVTCEYCGAKIKQYQNLLAHKAKIHQINQASNAQKGKDGPQDGNTSRSDLRYASTPSATNPSIRRNESAHNLSPIIKLSSTFNSSPVKSDAGRMPILYTKVVNPTNTYNVLPALSEAGPSNVWTSLAQSTQLNSSSSSVSKAVLSQNTPNIKVNYTHILYVQEVVHLWSKVSI